MMSKYQDSKVYKIVVGDGVYVGSTTMTLRRRLNEHKNHFNAKKRNNKSLTKLFVAVETLPNKFEDVRIELVEHVSCETKEQLLEKERHWIHELNANLNMLRLLNKTKEDNRQWWLEYREKPEVKAKKAERDRKYREKMGEVLLEKKREYGKTHKRQPLTQEQKDEKNAKRRERGCCPHCNVELAQGAISRHIKVMHSADKS